MSDETPIRSIKGFGADWTCLGYQFAVGETYEHTSDVKACVSGFHACPADEHPLSVFEFYPPAGSRYADVVQSGATDRQGGKIASARITIEAEITLPVLAQRAVDWVMSRAKPEGPSATGEQGAASATDYQGAASATDYQGAASATGRQGAASATGEYGVASATGDHSVATAAGTECRALGADGCALFLVRRNGGGAITHAWAGIVGRDGIKPDTWYHLDASGVPQEWRS